MEWREQPKPTGETGSLVVLVFGKIGICKLAHWHKQGCDPEPLQSPQESHVFVVRPEINAGVLPHGNAEDDIADENERRDPDLGENPDDNRGQSYDDECAGAENQPGIRCRVTV